MTHENISWLDFQTACDNVIDQLRGDVRVRRSSTIIAVARGGFVPATILSYALRLDKILALNLPELRGCANNRDDLVVVDDICDTGLTFSTLRIAFPNAVFVAPFVKPRGRPLCAYWSRELPQDTWAVFPYALDDVVNR